MTRFSHSNIALFAVLVVIAAALAGSNLPNLITGAATGSANVTVSTSTSITLTTSTIDFGSLAGTDGESNSTTDGGSGAPAGFRIRNDGNVAVNITAQGTSLWNTSSNPTPYFQIKCSNTTEWNCTSSHSVNWTDGVDVNFTYTDVPESGEPTKFLSNLTYQAAQDTVDVDVNITVPVGTDEGAGVKTAELTFTASSCGCPA